METLQSYVSQGGKTLKKWLAEPKVLAGLGLLGAALGGFCLSAASLAGYAQPFAVALVLVLSGWQALAAALGSYIGYFLFWGNYGRLCLGWSLAALSMALALGGTVLVRQAPLLLPALGSLIVASIGTLGQAIWQIPGPPVPMYLLQVLLAGGCTCIFTLVRERRTPIAMWLSWGVAVLALAQIMPIPYLGLGYVAAGALMVAGAFPAAALAGLALDLARVTPVPMTAVLTAGYVVRFLPIKQGLFLLPGLMYVLLMSLWGQVDFYPLPGLVLGGILGRFLPMVTAVPHRRGETGVLQVRLEMVCGVLAQTEQLLSQAEDTPIDREALVARAAEAACRGCPCGRSCRDSKRLAQLPPVLLQKPLLSSQELPVVCRKSGRFLAELRRSQGQLRSICADRERQREYRGAVMQQYRFLEGYLQELSDTLGRRREVTPSLFRPVISFYGNRPQGENGDYCQEFPGIEDTYYVLLCDGMGTGAGAVGDGRTAGSMLKKLLSSGYPAEYALRSLNSLLVLTDRPGAVTIDLVQLHLNTGKGTLYKWGAVPSYVVGSLGVRKVGSATPPPGLSVTEIQESREEVSLRRGESLVLVSDGIPEEDAQRCCARGQSLTPPELATQLISRGEQSGPDDATVVIVRLENR